MPTKKRRKASTLSERFVAEVSERLSRGKQVRRTLPLEGRLHIDRTLPFLVVYRRPPDRPDPGTDKLVMGEASYLIVSASRRIERGVSRLVRSIVKTQVEKCKAFLIIELWAAGREGAGQSSGGPPARPAFRLVANRANLPTVTLQALLDALKRVRLLRRNATVEMVYARRQWPEDFSSLLPSSEARRLSCSVIGLEVKPIYQNPDSGEVYPLLLRRLHRDLASALKRGVFEFAHQQTSLKPSSYQALGRRAVVKAVWEVDRSLAEISNSFDFLLQVTPVNIDEAWNQFKRKQFRSPPEFFYRPLPVDPALLKRQLYDIPIERVEDPTLSLIFREKRTELDQKLSMLGDRGTRKFLYGSLQLFGNVSDALAKLAREILEQIPPHSREGSGGKRLTAEEFLPLARKEIEYYRRQYPEMACRAEIRDDTSGLMVSRGNLLIGQRIQIPESRVEALLQHEVGTHALTYFNGRAQPFQQLYTGLAGYDELQEGLAVLSEYLVGGLSRPRLRVLAARVIATRHLIDGVPFADTFHELSRTYGLEQRTAYSVTARIYRGGGLTKDAVYLRGLVSALKYVGEGGRLEILFVGKIGAHHVPLIRELRARRVLKSAPLRPRYLDGSKCRERLARLQNGVLVLDLVKRRK